MAKKVSAATNGKARRSPPSSARSSAREISDPLRSFVDGLELPDVVRLIELAMTRRNELRSTARTAFLEEVRSRAKTLGVPLTELTGSRQERQKSGRPAKSRTTAGQRAEPPVKYRNAETGETWTGLGRTARWLAALESKGHNREEYAVSAQSESD